MAKTYLKQKIYDDKSDVFWVGSASGIQVVAGWAFSDPKS